MIQEHNGNGNGNGHSLVVLTDGQSPVSAQVSPALRIAADVMMDRLRWAKQVGLTFGGARDMYEVFGYDRLLTFRQYLETYQRGGIAGRVVDVFPQATWRGTVELIEDQDPEKVTKFEQAWLDLDKQHQIQAKLLRVDKLSLLSTFAVLLIGAPGKLEDPLPQARNPKDLLYLTPFSGGGGPGGDATNRTLSTDADATIAEFEKDTSNPRFGLPKSYQLKRVDVATPQLAQPVHWTRILHVADQLLDNDVYGQPALERVWNLLQDLDKVTGGGSEAFWLRANQGLHLDIDKDMALPDVTATVAALKEQSEQYKHQMTRWLRTRGVDVTTLGSDVANFLNPADAILTQIAGAKAIPKRILTGSEMGELASSQDRENWKDQVNGRQTSYAGPYIVRPLVDRLIEFGYLPTPEASTGYEVRWPHIQILTEQEKVEGAKGWAATNQTYGDVVYTDDEIRDKWSDMAPLTEEQLKKLADLRKQKVDEAQAAMAAQQPAEPDAAAADKKDNAFPRAAAQHDELVTILADAIEADDYNTVRAIVRVLGETSA